jgi:hypothetical protein
MMEQRIICQRGETENIFQKTLKFVCGTPLWLRRERPASAHAGGSSYEQQFGRSQ